MCVRGGRDARGGEAKGACWGVRCTFARLLAGLRDASRAVTMPQSGEPGAISPSSSTDADGMQRATVQTVAMSASFSGILPLGMSRRW
jgi:hypothetical protein